MKLSPIRPKLSEEDQLTRILLLVDYSNVLYRSYFSSIRSLNTHPWLPVVRFLDSLRLFVRRTRIDHVPVEFIFAGESQTKLDRTIMDKTYKAQRTSIDDDIFKQFRKLMPRVLEDMDVPITRAPGAEADDVIASIVGYICNRHNLPWELPKKTSTDVFIFSGDKDLYQLLDFDRCYIYKYQGVFYTREEFEKEYGFGVHHFDSYKAMVGDRSDNISGVNGIGPVHAKKHILENTIPIDDPEYKKAFDLVSLNFDLDVPTVGTKLWFNEGMSRSEPLIFEYYEKAERAFSEIQLSLKLLSETYNEVFSEVF